MEIEITVRGEVATGRVRFRHIRTKSGADFTSAYNPAHVTKWREFARLAAQEAMAGRPPLMGALHAEFVIVLPVPKSFSNKRARLAIAGVVFPITRPDASNYLKTCEDSLLGIAYRDDAQIVSLSVRKIFGAIPRLMVRLKTLDDAVEPNLFDGTVT